MGFLSSLHLVVLCMAMLLCFARSARVYHEGNHKNSGRNTYADPSDAVPGTRAAAMLLGIHVVSTPLIETGLHLEGSTAQSVLSKEHSSDKLGLRMKDSSSATGVNSHQKLLDRSSPVLTLSTLWKGVLKVPIAPQTLDQPKLLDHSSLKISSGQHAINTRSSTGAFGSLFPNSPNSVQNPLYEAPPRHAFHRIHPKWKVPSGPNPIDEPPPTPVFRSVGEGTNIPNKVNELHTSSALDFFGKVPEGRRKVDESETLPLHQFPRCNPSSVVYGDHLPTVAANSARESVLSKKEKIKKMTKLQPDHRCLREVPNGPDIPPPHAFGQQSGRF